MNKWKKDIKLAKKAWKEVDFAQALEDSGTKPYWKYLLWGYIIVALLHQII